MTCIALFGGSFNPPHMGHQLAVLYVLETQPVDELWIAPTYSHPFGKQLASYDQRVEMCKLMVAPLGSRVHVSRIEEELAQRPNFSVSHTLELVRYLVNQGLNIRLVVGADILRETGKWYRWAEVVENAPLIVLGRGGYKMPPGSVETGVTMPEISSSQVRTALAATDQTAAAGLLPRSVRAYIAERGLYKGTP